MSTERIIYAQERPRYPSQIDRFRSMAQAIPGYIDCGGGA